MNNLWYSLRELRNSWIFKVIILIQIIIAIVLLYRVSEVKNYEYGKLNLMNEIVESKTIYSICNTYESGDEVFTALRDTNKLSQFSKNIEEKYKLVTVTPGEVSMKNFPNRNAFIDTELDRDKGENEFEPICSLQCSDNFFDTFGIKLAQGDIREFIKSTSLTSDERKGQILPVLLGDSYKGIFKLNDVIETKYNTLKVTGFLEKNQFYLDKGVYDPTRCESLNTFIITPISKDIKEANIPSALLISDTDENNDFFSIQKDIEELSKEFNYKFSIGNPKENIDNFVEVMNYDANIRILLVYIVMFFVVIGLLAIFSNRINARRKEFSIHIMHGATYMNIYIRVLLEHFYLLILSITIAFYYTQKMKYEVMFQMLNFDLKAFEQAVLVIFIVMFVVSMVPIYKISRNRLEYLIKGE